jgi:DNA-binding MarR family transcriptional regulator
MSTKLLSSEKKVAPLPDELFTILAHLIPGLNLIAQKCDVSLGEWLFLWYLQTHGVDGNKSGRTMLRKDFTNVLLKHGFTGQNITRRLDTLVDKGFILRPTLSSRERQELFPDSPGSSRLAVVLLPAGERKITKFKELVSHRFQEWSETASGASFALLGQWFEKNRHG